VNNGDSRDPKMTLVQDLPAPTLDPHLLVSETGGLGTDTGGFKRRVASIGHGR